jgi:hypothetical protein
VEKYPALKAAFRYCQVCGIQIPQDVLGGLERVGIKTAEYYEAQLTRLVKSLYKGNMDELEFVQVFGDLIDGQLTKAWYEGLAENGLTKDDMTEEWQAILDGVLASEHDSILGFADEIAAASELTGEPIDPYLARVQLWANRYEDVKNQAIMASAEEKTKLEWIYGDTEHCGTCAQLNGVVAYASEWDRAGLHPQQPPNGMLECGGWRCQCQLAPTDKRHTRNVMDKLLAIGLG